MLIFEDEVMSFLGAFSRNVLYYQQITIARSQVSFYANNYKE